MSKRINFEASSDIARELVHKQVLPSDGLIDAIFKEKLKGLGLSDIDLCKFEEINEVSDKDRTSRNRPLIPRAILFRTLIANEPPFSLTPAEAINKFHAEILFDKAMASSKCRN